MNISVANASSEIISVLLFLLPGFVAATVFYFFTSHQKPNEFGQVVHALAFTMAGHLIAGSIQLLATALGAQGAWHASLEIIVPTLSAVSVALIAVYLSNKDLTHKAFRLNERKANSSEPKIIVRGGSVYNPKPAHIKRPPPPPPPPRKRYPPILCERCRNA